MAPNPTYDPPNVQLGRLMVDARRRGLDFEAWWQEAVEPGKEVLTSMDNPPAGAVRWPSDYHERGDWKAAVDETKGAWQRSFERGAPSRGDLALAILADYLGVEVEEEDDDLDAEAAELAELMVAA